MRKLFISGSRTINCLPYDFQQEMTRLVTTNNYEFLIGDCEGVDSLVQKLLYNLGYDNVTIYASGNIPRNFYGSINWKKILLDYPMIEESKEYYAIKDSKMSMDCDLGIVVWDGKSKATKNNIKRLRNLNKEVVIYRTGCK